MQSEQSPAPDSTAVRTALWRAMHVQVDPPPHVFVDEIGLKLAAPDDRWRERQDRRPPRAQRPFGPDVVAQDAVLPPVTRSLDLAQNHLPVPHSFPKQPIHHRLVGVKLALARCRPLAWRCATPPHRATHRARMNPHLRGDVLDVHPLCDPLVYH
jgi:hypothetical protein